MDAKVKDGWQPRSTKGLLAHLGPLLAKDENGSWRYGLATDERHANPIGLIHGGTLATLADQAMSIVAWEAVDRQPVATVHMDVNYLNSGKPGDFLEAEAKIVEKKGSLLFLEARIHCGETTLARASSVMKILKPR